MADPIPTPRDLASLAPLVDAAESLVRPQLPLPIESRIDSLEIICRAQNVLIAQKRFEADHYRQLCAGYVEDFNRMTAELERAGADKRIAEAAAIRNGIRAERAEARLRRAIRWLAGVSVVPIWHLIAAVWRWMQ